MRKFKFFTNFDKEEKWLSAMSQKGYKFTHKMLGYHFQLSQSENSVIKIDYRTFKKQDDFENYCALFEDSGWKHITGTKNSGYQYFFNLDENRNQDIFSDVNSKAARYKRISQMWITLISCFIPILAALIITDSIDSRVLMNPKLLYYTPGLWEKTGVSFLGSFLFETPFALFRGFFWVLSPILIVLSLVFAFKANIHYHKAQKVKYRE